MRNYNDFPIYSVFCSFFNHSRNSLHGQIVVPLIRTQFMTKHKVAGSLEEVLDPGIAHIIPSISSISGVFPPSHLLACHRPVCSRGFLFACDTYTSSAVARVIWSGGQEKFAVRRRVLINFHAPCEGAGFTDKTATMLQSTMLIGSVTRQPDQGHSPHAAQLVRGRHQVAFPHPATGGTVGPRSSLGRSFRIPREGDAPLLRGGRGRAHQVFPADGDPGPTEGIVRDHFPPPPIAAAGARRPCDPVRCEVTERGRVNAMTVAVACLPLRSPFFSLVLDGSATWDSGDDHGWGGRW